MIMSAMPMETPARHGPEEAEFLETIEGVNRGLVPGALVGAEDDVGNLLLAAGFVEEADAFRARCR